VAMAAAWTAWTVVSAAAAAAWAAARTTTTPRRGWRTWAGKKWVWRDTSTRTRVPSRPMPMAALTATGRLSERVSQRGDTYLDSTGLAAILSRPETTAADDPLATQHDEDTRLRAQERHHLRAASKDDASGGVGVAAKNPMMMTAARMSAAGAGGHQPSSSGLGVAKDLDQSRGRGLRAALSTKGGGSRSPPPSRRGHSSHHRGGSADGDDSGGGGGGGGGSAGRRRRGSSSSAFAAAEAALGRQQLVAADGNWSPLEVLAGLVERRALEAGEQYEQVRALEWLEQWVRESDVALKTIARSKVLEGGHATGGVSSLRDEVTTRSVLRRASGGGGGVG